MFNLNLRNKLLLLNLGAMVPVLIVILAWVLPSFHKRLYEDRVASLESVVELAQQTVEQIHARAKASGLSEEEAMSQAKAAVKQLRYDGEAYFWINDTTPMMIMHPMNAKMDGADLNTFKDPNGKAFFVELTRQCAKEGRGQVDYLWPKPGGETPVSKVSYALLYKPWNWVIGSGVYLDDIEAAYRQLQVSILGGIGLIFLISSLICIAFSNRIAETLSATVARIKETGDHFQGLSVRLAEEGNSLSASVSETAASTQETSSAAEELMKTTSMSAKNSATSHELALKSQAQAVEGEETVQKMISSINVIRESNEYVLTEIQNSNNRIAEILKVIEEINTKTKVINDIVFQTKLLSFNASVEAARAGENGKGFAVVAEEVGNLARMSGAAAHDISTMLEQSTQRARTIIDEMKNTVEALVHDGRKKVDEGVVVAQSCGSVLSEIRVGVETVAGAVNEIAMSSREQSIGVAEINKAIAHIETATQGNATSSEKVAHYSADVKERAQLLQELVDQIQNMVDGVRQPRSKEGPKEGIEPNGRLQAAVDSSERQKAA